MRSLHQFLDSNDYRGILTTLLRISLAVIFIWFGVLKIFGFNPVYDLIYHSALPWLAEGIGFVILGTFETIIGLFLLANRNLLLVHGLLVAHLLGTFTTFIFGFSIVFEPYFPILSLGGEFVLKNAILALAGLLVLVQEHRRRRTS